MGGVKHRGVTTSAKLNSEISQTQAEIIEGGWRLLNWQGSGTKIY